MFQQLKTSFLYSPIPDSVPILKFRSTDEVSPLFLQRPAYQVGIITVMMISQSLMFNPVMMTLKMDFLRGYENPEE